MQAHDPRRVEILYSEDNALCRPLAHLYNRLSHEHPQVFDWEDRYASQFNAIGLRQPTPLKNTLHPFQDIPRQAYYRVHFQGDQQTRLVYLQDAWFGISGAFHTNVWVFKPGLGVGGDTEFFDPNSAGPGYGFNPKSIDLAVLFYPISPPPKKYKVYYLPYYFLKISTEKERAIIRKDLANHIITIFPGLLNEDSYTVQRLFEFRRNALIIAENEHAFLVYHLVVGRIDDLCYFATSGELRALREYGWNPGGEKR